MTAVSISDKQHVEEMVNQLTTCADSTLDFTRGERIVAIGIDESECSQYALNWAMENLSTKADQVHSSLSWVAYLVDSVVER